MNIVAAKVVALVSLFFLTLVFAILPIRLSSWALNGGRYKRALVSLASCFSGGIFLGVALLHLLPEVRETFDYVLCLKKVDTHYPITELTVAGGFLIILVFEQLVLLFHRPRPSSECDIANVPPHGCDRQRDCDNCRPSDGEEVVDGSASSGRANHVGGRNEGDGERSVTITRNSVGFRSPAHSSSGTGSMSGGRYNRLDQQSSVDDTPIDAAPPLENGVNGRQNDRQNGYSQNSGYQSTGNQTVLETVVLSGGSGNSDRQHEVAIVQPATTDDSQSDKTFASLVLLAALSLHSLFEGLALGLQSTANSTIQIFIAVLFHKCVLAFALGIRMVKFNSPKKRIVQAAFIFAVMSPLGALIGIGVDASSADEVDRKLVTACLQGLATGTFLFVTFLEVIAHEVQGNRQPGDADLQMMKLALIVIGFVAMALVELRHNPDEHGAQECHH